MTVDFSEALQMLSAATLRAIEFDRIVSIVAGLAVTPTGRDRLEAMAPMTEPSRVGAAQAATSEGVRFLAMSPGFPLRAPSELETILDGLQVEGRALEPLNLLGLADYLESIEPRAASIASATEPYPILKRLVEAIASFWQRDRRGAPQDRAVGRSGRQREPGAAPASATGCASSDRSCAPRSKASCANATRRSTCRSRWSPIATAATC